MRIKYIYEDNSKNRTSIEKLRKKFPPILPKKGKKIIVNWTIPLDNLNDISRYKREIKSKCIYTIS